MAKEPGTRVLPTREIAPALAGQVSPMVVNVTFPALRFFSARSQLPRVLLPQHFDNWLQEIVEVSGRHRKELVLQWVEEGIERHYERLHRYSGANLSADR